MLQWLSRTVAVHPTDPVPIASHQNQCRETDCDCTYFACSFSPRPNVAVVVEIMINTFASVGVEPRSLDVLLFRSSYCVLQTTDTTQRFTRQRGNRPGSKEGVRERNGTQNFCHTKSQISTRLRKLSRKYFHFFLLSFRKPNCPSLSIAP